MSRMTRWTSSCLGGGALLLLAHVAGAQDPDPAKKAPNVMLVVDTSGSMEYRAAQKNASGQPIEVLPSCSAGQKSRWIDLIEVLTGDIVNYSCASVDRHSFSAFNLPGNVLPPDVDYRIPYTRPISGDCTIGPDNAAQAALTNVFAWVPPRKDLTVSGATCTSGGFKTDQSTGLIPSFGDLMRFGLMTFDTLTDPSTGYANTSPDYSGGAKGAWSYFVGSSKKGKLADCADTRTYEVGVRNGAAPAWEGKLIPFGNPNAADSVNADRHSRIQLVLQSTRPYGATPIAGALTDAEDFFWNDHSVDPLDSSQDYGPYRDPYVAGGCREQYIILLTDGEPNLDMRPDCEQVSTSSGTSGTCPFSTPNKILQDLSGASTGKKITTYVVGFASSTYGNTGTGDCTTLSDSDLNSSTGLCATNPKDQALQICCTLNRLAYYGGTNRAYFSEDKTALRSSLAKILNTIVDASARSATQPVRSPGIGTQDTVGVTAGYRVLTSYSSIAGTGLMEGHVERMRLECDNGSPVTRAKDQTKGDDIEFNVGKDVTNRKFFTVLPALVNSHRYADRSIRPHLSATIVDGGGTITGTQVSGKGSAFTSISGLEDAMKASSNANIYGVAGTACAKASSATDCRDRVLKWVVGLDDGDSDTKNRCDSPGSASCRVFGDVLHSTPVFVNRPSASLSDETYTSFASTFATRPMAAYTSTNDGQLHAFQIAANSAADKPAAADANNELFSFFPPAVLPKLLSMYPNSRQKLLDGTAVVEDVVAIENPTSTTGYKFKLERGQAQTTGASSTFRTILVQGFGGSQSGYFAVDITDPKLDPNDSTKGPQFLWQLTTDADGNPLFGTGGSPIITTVYVTQGASEVEVPVAILPGGAAGSPLSGTECARATNPALAATPSGYSPRAYVRCYEYDKDNDGTIDSSDTGLQAGPRSLTIVRLDTGEILKTFRRNAAEVPNIPSDRIALTALDSPLSGMPAAYPTGTGAVADRVFIGDQDGSLWRIDVSSTNISNWKMDLFFDGFSKHPQATDQVKGAAAGRPIVTRPVLSVDQKGQITVAFATGDQSLSGDAGEKQYIWSLTEVQNAAGTGFTSQVNWYETLSDGKHVLGPLELYNGIIYASTWSPDLSNTACGAGSSEVWGLDYLTPATTTSPGDGAIGRLSVLGSSAAVKSLAASSSTLGLSSSSVIFGVKLEFAPSCYDTATGSNDYLGKSTTTVRNFSPPQMQLSFQTGDIKTSQQSLGFKTGFEVLKLDPPRILSSLEAWAPILE